MKWLQGIKELRECVQKTQELQGIIQSPTACRKAFYFNVTRGSQEGDPLYFQSKLFHIPYRNLKTMKI